MTTRREIRQLARELHRQNGHPEGYDGPCWGPTQAELEEAERLLTEAREDR